LLAANFRSGKVEVYDTNYHQSQVFGATAFEDPALPAVPAGSGSPGYAPFGIHTVVLAGKTMVVVTYALQDTPMHDPLHIVGGGVVDLFNADGTMARRLTADSHLNAPWGVVIPPPSFGSFGANGNVLVGNFGDGVINAYDAASGTFVDQLKDSTGTAITNVSLWDMVFGQGAASGDPNTMYITAGLANEAHGLFSAITANATQAGTADFSIAASPASQTITAGQSAQFTITLGGLNGFNGAVALSCSGQPAGSTCAFTQTSLSPASGATLTTTMTINTSSSPYMPAIALAKNGGGNIYAMLLPIPALALLAIFIFGAPRKNPATRKMWAPQLVGSIALLIVTAWLLAASGCGYNAPSGTGTQRGMNTVLITGTSGNLSHSASVALTVQ
jgi:hypothetical protein